MIRESRPHAPATARTNQAGREQSVVPVDERSAEQERPEDWGWHAEMGRWGRRLWPIAFVAILGYLLSYLLGPHEDRVSDLWLAGLLVVMLLIVFRDWRRRRNAWRAR